MASGDTLLIFTPLCDEPPESSYATPDVRGGRPVLHELSLRIGQGENVAIVGPNGCGKSTLINRLLDRPMQETSVIRDYDGKGRHTTTVRQLFIMRSGALMIDNPGIREVGIGTASTGMSETFPDIQELAEGCRFSDCRHEQEPGCAVLAAVKDGTLSSVRLENYHRLMREHAFAQDKAEIGLARSERKRWKGIAKLAKEITKTRT